LSLVDGRDGESKGEFLEVHSRIRRTEQTDLEITFYSKHVIVNNTDQSLLFLQRKDPKEKRLVALACQNVAMESE